jgi:hypothetical protein
MCAVCDCAPTVPQPAQRHLHRQHVNHGRYLGSGRCQGADAAALRAAALTLQPQTSVDLINVFFYFVAGIGITLCFFILLVSFDASVRQVPRNCCVSAATALPTRMTCFTAERVGVRRAAVVGSDAAAALAVLCL